MQGTSPHLSTRLMIDFFFWGPYLCVNICVTHEDAAAAGRHPHREKDINFFAYIHFRSSHIARNIMWDERNGRHSAATAVYWAEKWKITPRWKECCVCLRNTQKPIKTIQRVYWMEKTHHEKLATKVRDM